MADVVGMRNLDMIQEDEWEEFHAFGQGAPDTLSVDILFRYWRFGLSESGRCPKTWEDISMCDIVIYPYDPEGY